jgi:putative cardiolipin synthase
MGLVVDSPALAGRLADAFDGEIPRVAYQVQLAPEGRGLVWIERTGAGEITYDTEPGTSWWLRAKVEFMSILPIEWLL